MPTQLKPAAATLAVLVLALTGCQGALDDDAPTAAPTASESTTPTPTPEPEPTTITLSAVGDWLPHDSVVYDAEQPDGTYDFAHFADAVAPRWADSDLVMCDQEVPSAGDETGLSFFPRFNAPSALTTGMAAAGCDTINLANNHLADWGQQGIDITRAQWDALQPALIAGANRSPEEQQTVSVTEIDGVRVAFLAFTQLSNEAHDSFALNRLGDTALVESLMAQAVEQSDVQIVSVHWGTEYSLTEDPAQVEQGQWLADLGADVIMGTGPHVLQPASWITRADGTPAFVFYSVGNFLSTQIEIPRILAAIAQIDLVVDPDGTVTVQDPRAIPIYMHYDLTPQQLASNQLINRVDLQVYPLVDAAEPLTRSAWRNELTVESGIQFVTDVLGPDVRITP
ncbi:CapA family protein [Agrococcus jejuensis]|uniref:Poly-gamma-glutamate synthesis protein (Capsule biosynthesis protein) n=1 Tax=Agrococcus jejuensis TaxID=399736 RepID=A0A1G8ELL3_9MICO|nr:CapA family protein [Agrococcus jejuensis]SDH70609.1 poly-gamma-glutamate synthesis protein (capsule biosynthesis protein) [Agrococcus jejuensis]